MSNNGSNIELMTKSSLDQDFIDNKQTIIFNQNNKYAKGDTLYYPVGNPNWSNTIRFYIEKQGDLLYGLYLIVKLPKISISTYFISIPNE